MLSTLSKYMCLAELIFKQVYYYSVKNTLYEICAYCNYLNKTLPINKY